MIILLELLQQEYAEWSRTKESGSLKNRSKVYMSPRYLMFVVLRKMDLIDSAAMFALMIDANEFTVTVEDEEE